MRTRTAILTGALLLASSALAVAQQTQTQPQAQPTTSAAPTFTPKFGQFDFGFRADDVSGDEARYNRYRDLRGGAVFDAFRFTQEKPAWYFRAEADNVGYRDQRYLADFQSIGKLKAAFEWTQVPLYSAVEPKTLYSTNGGSYLAIDDAVQQSIQNAGTNTAARDAALNAAFANARTADLYSRRDVGMFDMVYSLNRDTDVKFRLRNSSRTGNQVLAFGFGTSPGLNPAVEMGAPMDDRTTDVNAALEFANAKGLASFGYTGSWYNQNVPFVKFDNPLRANDISAGPSAGQFANWPTNASFSVNANGAYTLAKRTRASAGLSIGRWSQDEALPPMTVNTALVSPSLERATAQTEADITSLVFNLNSRPTNALWLNAKYRYYNYDNTTPHFTATNAIIGDWAYGTQVHETEPASFKRKTLDLDASFTPVRYLSFGAGYGREDADRTFRIYENTAEDTFRLTFDSTANQYVSFRLKYEHSDRAGSGFEEHLLEEVGEQPETRHYDIANRTRDRVSALVTVTPLPWLAFNASVSDGDDNYEETGFGMRDNANRAYSFGFDAFPIDTVSFGLNYGHEKYTAYQYSRTANPAPDPTFYDPARDWSIDQNDTVNTFGANLSFLKALPKTDIRFSYDVSDGEATYVYGGPAITNTAIFSSVPFQALVPVTNTLTDFKADVQYFVRPNVALGLGYWYEEYEVKDFALGPETLNAYNPVNGTTGVFASTIYSGYLYRPYKGNNFWVRMTYLW
jgi:MtrB/PioB family decaheme-associated outer membrane protein